ncbi:MAG: calcium-activated chloride channel regulator 3/4 [Candidatus Sumerlaeota bacterium]|nr:calcium-activated chloride channel regulator 3/4 [Candidatus Sumerlaeota bacterium]
MRLKKAGRWMRRLAATSALLAVIPVSVAQAGTGVSDGTADVVDINLYFTSPLSPTDLDKWKDHFQNFSNRMYTATGQQQRIRDVNVFIRAVDKKENADIVIGPSTSPGGNATVSGFGKKGARIFIPEQRIDPAVLRAPDLSLIHEWGHYCYGLGDEYLGQYVPLAKKDTWSKLDLRGSLGDLVPSLGIYRLGVQNQFVHNQPAGEAMADKSIMSGPNATANPLGFSTATWHNAGRQDGTKWWMSHHQYSWNLQDKDHASKPHWGIMLLLKDSAGEPMFSEEPADYPASLITAPDINWIVNEPIFREVICIDRSGSMTTDNRMDVAKAAARMLVDLGEGRRTITTNKAAVDQESDWFGIVSYSTDVTANSTLQPLGDNLITTTASKIALKSVINGLSPTGSTNIGGGLQESLNQHLTAGGVDDKASGRHIFLMSDGQHNTGTHPDSVLPTIKANGIKVFSIGLGNDVDRDLMGRIADATDGKYRFVGDVSALSRVFLDIFGETRGGLTASESVTLGAGESSETLVQADEGTDRVLFMAGAASVAGLNFTVQAPDGTVITPAKVNNGTFEQGDNILIYRIDDPDSGEWKMLLENTSGGEMIVNAAASLDNAIINVSAFPDKSSYTFPEAVQIIASVTWGSGVSGASVLAEITGPSGIPQTATLFDDGDPMHGDREADDGLYSNFLTPNDNGAFNVRVDVENIDGVIKSMEPLAPDDVPVPPFKRSVSFSFNYIGAPEAQPNYIRVDNWNLSLNPRLPDRGFMIFRGEVGAPIGMFDPANNGAQVTFGPLDVPMDQANFRASRGSLVTYRDGNNVIGQFLLNKGGSSRSSAFVIARGDFSSLQGDTQVPVTIASGNFNRTTTIEPKLKGIGANMGSTGSTFLTSRDFYNPGELFVDSALILRFERLDGRDQMRVAMRFPGAPEYDYAQENLVVNLGFRQLDIAPEDWRVLAGGRVLLYREVLPDGAWAIVIMQPERDTISVQLIRADIPAQNPDIIVGIGYGGFVRNNLMTTTMIENSALQLLRW